MRALKRVLTLIAVACVAVVGAGALSAGRACAHDPRFACSPRDARHPILIADPEKSWAYYGRLGVGAEDHYEVEAAHALTVPVQVLVDQRDASDPLRPVAVVADRSGREISKLNLAGGRPFFEPFSRVTYVAGPEQNVEFPAGLSTITVTMRGSGAPQRYTLAIGADERFSVWELPYLLGAAYRIHARRF
ncbi:MAG TPA: hypothetical protein VMU38_03605 [Candidatus Binatia bacterium]|nr:hypothetical protein [Candidatus Binatia bacterium]